MEGLVTEWLFSLSSFCEQDEDSFLDTVLITFVCWDSGAVEQIPSCRCHGINLGNPYTALFPEVEVATVFPMFLSLTAALSLLYRISTQILSVTPPFDH